MINSQNPDVPSFQLSMEWTLALNSEYAAPSKSHIQRQSRVMLLEYNPNPNVTIFIFHTACLQFPVPPRHNQAYCLVLSGNFTQIFLTQDTFKQCLKVPHGNFGQIKLLPAKFKQTVLILLSAWSSVLVTERMKPSLLFQLKLISLSLIKSPFNAT